MMEVIQIHWVWNSLIAKQIQIMEVSFKQKQLIKEISSSKAVLKAKDLDCVSHTIFFA